MKRHNKVLLVLCICLIITGCEKESSNTESQGISGQITGKEEVTVRSGKKDSSSKKGKKQQIVRQPEKEKKTEPTADTMVRVLDYIPDIKIDLRYSTKNNFTGKKVYEFKEAYLRYGTVVKLKRVQTRLKKKNYILLIWDAYRPVYAQYQLWKICPNPAYVANPHNGYSSHSRGNTVDITMLTLQGEEVKMPTDFDDFSERADRDYSDCSPEERKNAKRLENIMKEEGFTPYSGEWWHFSDTHKYPVKKAMKRIK